MSYEPHHLSENAKSRLRALQRNYDRVNIRVAVVVLVLFGAIIFTLGFVFHALHAQIAK